MRPGKYTILHDAKLSALRYPLNRFEQVGKMKTYSEDENTSDNRSIFRCCKFSVCCAESVAWWWLNPLGIGGLDDYSLWWHLV